MKGRSRAKVWLVQAPHSKGTMPVKTVSSFRSNCTQIFFSTPAFPNCGYEISMTGKIRLALHDLPEILPFSSVNFGKVSKCPLVNWVGNFSVFYW